MIWFYLALVVVALEIWLRYIVNNEVEEDYAAINADGSKDSLKKEWHRKSAFKIGVFAFCFAMPFYFYHWSTYLAMLFIFCATFWYVFDIRLNQKRGLPNHYVGYTAEIDKFFRKHFKKPEKAMAIVKIVCILVGFYALFLSFQLN